MKRFVVTITILCRAPHSTPADVTYYRGENEVQALAALVSGATTYSSVDEAASLPESMKFDVTAVRMDIYKIEEDPS